MKSEKKVKAGLVNRFILLLAHRYFFIAVAVFFVLQMVWIALSAIYPMLFDEEYHLGIIEIYSRQISPFIFTQPPEAAFHGDITRYNSYFFHYVMSFPYRIITLFTQDLMTQVIAMRFVCISFVIFGFWLFRKVLLNFGVSRAVAHVSLFIFTLIPLVPFALAQINYDALLFVIIPLLLLLTQKASRRSPRQTWYILLFVILTGFATITKFTVLPIILSCFAYLGYALFRQHSGKLFRVLLGQLRETPRVRLIIAGFFLIVSLGLVAERYGINLITYKSLEPACEQLHSYEECSEYTVFRRNTTWQERPQASQPRMNPLEYSKNYWVPHVFGDFTVVAAFIYDDKSELSLRVLPTTLHGSAGNPILRYGSWVILAFSALILAVAAFRRKLTPTSFFALFGTLFLVYSVALWARNYSDYLHIGTPVAAQGRYYIWLLIPTIAMVAVAFRGLIKNIKFSLAFFVVSLLLLTQGGGVANYMLYSNKEWYWPRHEQAIEQANRAAQRTLRLFTPL